MINNPYLHDGGGGEAIPYETLRHHEITGDGGSRGWRISEIACWTLILCIVALVSVRAVLYQRAHSIAAIATPQFPGMCKYAVAIHSFQARLPAAQARLTDQSLTSLDRMAKTPQEKLRLAIVYGEFHGPDAAAKRLAGIADPGTDPEFSSDLAEVKAIYALHVDGAPVPNAPENRDIQRLQDRLGWFADLAITNGRAETDAVRQHMLHDAYITLAILIAVELLVLGLLLAGLVLLIVAIVQLARGKIGLALRRVLDAQSPRADRCAYLQGFTAYLCLMVGLGYVARLVGASQILAEAIGLPLAFLGGLLWPLWRGESRGEWRTALGLRAGRGVVREIFSGIVGYLTGTPLLAVAFIAVYFLERIAGYTPTHPIDQELGSTGQILFAFFLASVWAPLTEELMFRGAFFSSLRERFGWWISAPVMAVVFAGVHPQGYVAVPVIAAIAVTFAGIREWRGSIIGSMAAHSLHNTATLFILLFLMRS